MRLQTTLLFAGIMVIGTASNSPAQVSLAVGDGFSYPGYGIAGSPGFGYPGLVGAGYRYGPVNNGLYARNDIARPGVSYYNSGYRGFTPAYGAYGSGGRPVVRGYGYGYGRPFAPSRRGFR